VLQFLITSKVRRRLLALLWGEAQTGSAAELAALAGVAFAGAHGELKAMQRAQLAVSRKERGQEVFAANFDHPEAAPLRALVASAARLTVPNTVQDPIVRGQLVALGAPLRGVEPIAVAPADQMSVLLAGVQLARRDAVVARSLPLCVWHLREQLDMKRLAGLAFRAEDRHALGFMIELAGELGGDRRLAGLADRLRDRRITLPRDFFQRPAPRAPGVDRDFPLAAKWLFRMNTDLEAFRTLFDKFVTT
jgi:hypothetical protein